MYFPPNTATCTTIHRYPIYTQSIRCCSIHPNDILRNVQDLRLVIGISEIEHGLCACTVDNPLAKARRLSLHTGAQTMLYLSHVPGLR